VTDPSVTVVLQWCRSACRQWCYSDSPCSFQDNQKSVVGRVRLAGIAGLELVGWVQASE
jgi:hypothetical protein